MQISNRTIAMLLIATILVYLGGTFISLNRLTELGYSPLTGLQSANVSVTISSTVSVTWALSSIPWGSGYVNSSCDNCSMQVNNTATAAAGTYGMNRGCCVSFNWTNTSLLLRNNGNQPVSIQFNVSDNRTMWFGTTLANSDFSFKIVDAVNRTHDNVDVADTVASCLGNNTHPNGWYSYESYSTWTSLDTFARAPTYICGDGSGKNFTFSSTANEANFDFRVAIPQAYSTAGLKSSLITVLATS